MKKIAALLLGAWLTVGQNYNLKLGDGQSVNLTVEQPLVGKLSARPSASWDVNQGFHDRQGGLDLVYDISKDLNVSMGATYEKYELLAANDPTETTNVHYAVSYRLW